MKKLPFESGKIDSADVALLLGLSIGLGIAVHEGFFLVAGAIAVGALSVAAVHAVYHHRAEHGRVIHQHP